VTSGESEALQVWIDQSLCTGDGLCVQDAPEVFEFDVDGLAYVKNGQHADLLTEPGARADVPDSLRADVIGAARACPGECIHVVRTSDDTEVAGPNAG
jgi:ferredoxin